MTISKTFTNILFLILIFQALCVEPPEYRKIDNFEPFISTPIFENYNMPKDSFEPVSYIDTSSVSTVKCIYLSDDYDLYDISGLCVNSLKTDVKEEGRKEKIKASNTFVYDIYFNFCYNLKYTDDCPYNNKQIYYKSVDNNIPCTSLGSGLGTGNKWKKETEIIPGEDNTSITRTILSIEVNQEKSQQHFTYKLACNESTEYSFVEDKSYFKIGDNEAIDILVYIESKHACAEYNFYFIWKFIQDYKVIFIIILMAFGAFNCVFGKKLVKFTTVSLIVLIITLLVLIFSQYILPSGCAEWIIWVMLAVGLILGGAAGYFVLIYNDKVISFVCGGVAGFFVGQFLFSLFGNRIPANGMVIYWVFIAVSIIVLTVVAWCFKKFIVIFTTSFIGSYCFIRGISLFAGGFPDETTVIDMRNKGEDEQLSDLLTWEVYVYLAAILILTVLSVYIQFKLNKETGSDDDEGAPDSNLKPTAE